MNAEIQDRLGTPRLRLVSAPTPRVDPGRSSAPGIDVAPFRPGELPLISWVPLDLKTRELIGMATTTAGIPIDLWVRIAVEASRLVEEIATLSGSLKSEVASRLDSAAQIASRPPQQTGGHLLIRYAAELQVARKGQKVPNELALRLPEEMSGAWTRSAAKERIRLPTWIAQRLRSVPANCVGWEIAAASAYQSLGEWAYASSLRASASSSA